MSNNLIKGKAQTVLGLVDPQSLGPTMTHEHLLIDFRVMFNPQSSIRDPRSAIRNPRSAIRTDQTQYIRQSCNYPLDLVRPPFTMKR